MSCKWRITKFFFLDQISSMYVVICNDGYIFISYCFYDSCVQIYFFLIFFNIIFILKNCTMKFPWRLNF